MERLGGKRMDFLDIAKTRQSCRSYDGQRAVEGEKLDLILEAARLAPSACNGQPYHVTVCRGEGKNRIIRHTQGMGMNKFATDAPIALVISEEAYVATAALGARAKGIDYRAIDIGIVAAYITAEAAALGLGTCILGWVDSAPIERELGCGAVKLIITLGYASEDDVLREKKRKPHEKLFSEFE